jgi:hypothetical protein
LCDAFIHQAKAFFDIVFAVCFRGWFLGRVHVCESVYVSCHTVNLILNRIKKFKFDKLQEL